MWLMEKFLLFVMLLAVGVVSGIMLLSKNQQSATQQDIGNTISGMPTSALNKPQPTSVPTQPALVDPQSTIAATQAIIKTSRGDITLQLFASEAAKTVTNFAQKAQSGYYNGLTFHRVEDWVIQGGDPLGNGTGGKDMVTELNNEPFVVGSLGMAGHQGEGGIINNDSQFFITKKDSSFLNDQYTNFGKVISGMDVVNQIQIGDKILGITVQ